MTRQERGRRDFSRARSDGGERSSGEIDGGFGFDYEEGVGVLAS